MFIKLVSNERKIAVAAWNKGVMESTGDLIFIIGAHSTHTKNFISSCVKWSNLADNVGGTLKSFEIVKTIMSKATTIVRDDIFGVGKAGFRQKLDRPKYVDTVFGGCYRREVFDKVGLFNENLERTGDLEFNLRLKRIGLKTLLIPGIKNYYYARSTLLSFVKHSFKDGIWSVLPMAYSDVDFGYKRLLPLLFVLTFPLSIWPYLLIAFTRSVYISKKEKEPRLMFAMPLAFLLFHISYGIGNFWGIIRLLKVRI